MSIAYLIEVSICIMVIYLFYYFLLKKSHYFNANRFYLLGGVLFSFIIPILDIDLYVNDQIDFGASGYVAGFTDPIFGNTAGDVTNNYQQGNNSIIQNLYLTGVFTTLLIFVSRIFFLLLKRREFTSSKILNKKVWLTHGKMPTSSFLTEIYWDETQNYDEESTEIILKHEARHIDHLHSMDIIFLELIKGILWFNPFIYFINNEAKLIHEFSVDSSMLATVSKEKYSKLIISLLFPKSSIPLMRFSEINVKPRLKMIHSNPLNKMRKLNYLLTVPMIFGLLCLFGCSKFETIVHPFHEFETFQIIDYSDKFGLRVKIPENKKHWQVHNNIKYSNALVIVNDNLQIKGILRDKSNRPLEGVSVFRPGGNERVITDKNGIYKYIMPNTNHTVLIAANKKAKGTYSYDTVFITKRIPIKIP